MGHLCDHAANGRAVDPGDYLVQALESQALYDQFVLGRGADRAPDILDPHRARCFVLLLLLCHDSQSPGPRLQFLCLFAAYPGHIFRHFQSLQAVEGCLDDIVRIGATERFGQDV